MNFFISLLFLKWKNIMSKLFLKHSSYSLPVLEDYSLLETIKIQYSPISPSVGIYKNKHGEKVIIKSFQFKIKNFKYYQFLKEVAVLRQFEQRLRKRTIGTPKVLDLLQEKQRISIILEFIPGESLYAFPHKKQLETVITVINALENLQIDEKDRTMLGIHSKHYIGSSFLVYLLIACIKDVKNISKNLDAGIFFYKNYFSGLFSPKKITYVFSHRDVYFDHIIISNNKIYLIDLELAVLTQRYTDLALFSKTAYTDIGEKIRDFIAYYCADALQYREFLNMSVYCSIQSIALMPEQHQTAFNAKNYIANFILKEIHNLRGQKGQMRQKSQI